MKFVLSCFVIPFSDIHLTPPPGAFFPLSAPLSLLHRQGNKEQIASQL